MIVAASVVVSFGVTTAAAAVPVAKLMLPTPVGATVGVGVGSRVGRWVGGGDGSGLGVGVGCGAGFAEGASLGPGSEGVAVGFKVG